MKTRNTALLLLATAAAIAPAYAQTGTPSFTITYNFSDANLRALTDGTVITFPAVDVNATATAVITIANQGTAPGVLNNAVASGAAFQVAGMPLLPAAIPAGQFIRFGIIFTPAQIGSFSGGIRIELAGLVVSGSLAGSTASPNLAVNYVDPPTNNVIPLPDGATLQFPDTPEGSASTVTVLVPNTGAGTGNVTSIVLSGNTPAVFELINLLPTPIAVPPSQQLRFGIRFSATEQQAYSATLSLNLNGQVVSVKLAARVTGRQFTYTYSADAPPVSAGGTLRLPDTPVGQTSSVKVTVLNTGTGNGQIGGIGVSGQGLTVADLPLFPVTLRPNQTQQFTLIFSPTQPGDVTGRLVVGGDLLSVACKAIGPRLTYTYTNSAAESITVLENGTIFLPPTAVGGTQKLEFAVRNAGTGPETLSSITVSAPGSTFTVQDVPGLPMKLDPGNTIAFPIVFSPTTAGSLTAVLRVNTSAFTLSGTGNAPAALPSYQLTTNAASPQPAEQPTIGLSLSSPYPLPVQGVLVMSFISDVFVDDPAIQFASGGRTVKFTIPANTTQALFNTVSGTIPIQTGTTAGKIVLTPSFALQEGYDLTPPEPAILTISIPRSAPRLLSGSVTVQTLNTLTVTISGYTTCRSLQQLDVQITPKAGEKLATARLAIDLASSSALWFQGAASQQLGGAFKISIPFVLQNGNTAEDLVHRLESFSITASNDTGSSNQLVIPVP